MRHCLGHATQTVVNFVAIWLNVHQNTEENFNKLQKLNTSPERSFVRRRGKQQRNIELIRKMEVGKYQGCVNLKN